MRKTRLFFISLAIGRLTTNLYTAVFMKKYLKSVVKLIAVLLSLFAACSCSKELTEDIAPVPHAKGTVTLTLSMAETKTSLFNDKSVLWSEGDKVLINDVLYDVSISEDDPAKATVENVAEADAYYAIYVYSWTDNKNPQYWHYNTGEDANSPYYVLSLPSVQHYQEGTFAQYTNPMVGYGKDTNIKFHNLGSVVKIGLTGNGETISNVKLLSNGGASIGGFIKVAESQFISGIYSDAVVDTNYSSYDAVNISCESSSAVLSSTPTWFYFVTIPFSDESGISIAAEDTEGNVFTYSKTDSFSVGRSEIIEMPSLEFSAFKAVELSLNEGTSAVSISVDAVSEPGKSLRGTVVSSATWERYISAYENDEQSLAQDFIDVSSSVQYFLSGETAEFDKARNYVGNMVAIAPQTSYKVIVQYCLGIYGVGKCAVLDVTTPSASGDAPALELDIESITFNEIQAKIIASDAANISLWLFSKAEYEALGKTDSEIMKDYGKPLSEEEIANANSDGCSWHWWSLSPSTDYVILVVATSATGAETVVKKELSTSYYIFDPETVEFETVTVHGKLVTNLFYAFRSISSALAEMTFSELTVKKVSGMDVFVIENLFKGNADLQNVGFVDKDGDYLTIIDARDASAVDILFTMNDMGIYNTIYYGFSSPCRFGCYATYNKNVSREDYPLGVYDCASKKIEINSLVMGDGLRLYGVYSLTLDMSENPSSDEDAQALSIESFSKSKGNW